jgi:hypothetical protein
MSKKYYVSDGLNKVGPLVKDEVLNMLYNGHISLTDSIIDVESNEMCSLLQHEDFGGSGAQKNQARHDLIENTAAYHTGTITLDMDELRDAVKSKYPESARPSLNDLKKTNSKNFYLHLKGREFGPIKFLVLISLLHEGKIQLTDAACTEGDVNWKALSDFISPDVRQTLHITPVVYDHVLPKSMWKRKNVRLDYSEIIFLNNSAISLVGKAIDLSAEGIGLLWVYDRPVNEIFEISLFDSKKNIYSVQGTLARKEKIADATQLHKAVFIFDHKIPIKDFLT